jgi:predicted DCC family thiol-disulfide oxidoreductase YuxK
VIGPGPPPPGGPHVLFYDGVCGLCDRVVQFVLARDRRGRFRFATLQGAFAARELPSRGGNPEDLDSVLVLTAEGRLLRRSRAVLFVLGELGGGWAVLAWLRLLPAALTDVAYRLVARSRYRLFGRLDSCRLPRPAERARFIAE